MKSVRRYSPGRTSKKDRLQPLNLFSNSVYPCVIVAVPSPPECETPETAKVHRVRTNHVTIDVLDSTYMATDHLPVKNRRTAVQRATYSSLMWQERVRRYLLPGAAEDDPEFLLEIQRLSNLGLRVVGGVEVAVAAFLAVARTLVNPDPSTLQLRLAQTSAVIFLGFVSLGLSRVGALRRFSRAIAICSGLTVAGILIWFSLLMTVYNASADDFVPGQLALIMLVAVAALPMRPTDTLLLGFLIETAYVGLSLIAQNTHQVNTGVDSMYVLFIFMLSLLATGLTAVVYEQRRSTFQWHLRTLRAADDLRQAEARNLLAQNAASVGRLAAAISHELNSPIGALVSGVDTLILLASRQATAPPDQQPRLVVLQNELRKSIKQSTDRLKEIVTRMQRFTNLDKAEVQSANLNEIISDVVTILEPQYKEKAAVELQQKPVPDIVCRPQQLSAVFSSLLLNSVEATDAANGNGRVVLSTQAVDDQIEVKICDNGRGLDPSQLEGIFDPGFKVALGRVSTGNWGLFSSRQIVREHGGDITIDSTLGKGTCVSVLLPCSGCGGLEKPS